MSGEWREEMGSTKAIDMAREFLAQTGMTHEDALMAIVALARDELHQAAMAVHEKFYKEYERDVASRPQSQTPKANLRVEKLKWVIRARWMIKDFTTKAGQVTRMDRPVKLPVEDGKQKGRYGAWAYPAGILIEQIKPRDYELDRIRTTEAELAPIRAQVQMFGKIADVIVQYVSKVRPAAEKYRARSMELPASGGRTRLAEGDVSNQGRAPHGTVNDNGNGGSNEEVDISGWDGDFTRP